MANAYVFPGGCVDPADHVLAKEKIPNVPLGAFRVAGLRELAEETGLTVDAQGRITQRDSPEVTETSVTVLKPFAHWITPKQEKYRYDTWFFAIRGPADLLELELKMDPKEVSDIRWVTPDEALAMHADVTRNFTLPPPTYLVMQELSLMRTCQAFFDALAGKGYEADPVRAVPVNQPDLVLGETGLQRMKLSENATFLKKGTHYFPVHTSQGSIAQIPVVVCDEREAREWMDTTPSSL